MFTSKICSYSKGSSLIRKPLGAQRKVVQKLLAEEEARVLSPDKRLLPVERLLSLELGSEPPCSARLACRGNLHVLRFFLRVVGYGNL
jgi:hypothetical protein